LGQLLTDAHIVSAEQLEQVLALQKTDGRRLGTLLVESGLVTETQLTQILSQQLSVPWVSLYHIDFSRELLNLVPREIAERYCLVPIYIRPVRGQGDTLYVAMDDPMNEEALRECAGSAGLPARPMIAAPSAILKAIRLYYGGSASPPARPSSKAPQAETSATVATGAVHGSNAATTARSYGDPRPTAITATSEAGDGLLASELAGDNGVKGDGASAAPLAAVASSSRGFRPPVEDDSPVLEVREVELPQNPRRKAQFNLTLLDGTTIRMPSVRKKRADVEEPPRDASGQPEVTAAELLAALRAAAHGADAAEVLGSNLRWEKMMAAVLSLLIRKHLILDRELMEELRKI
jgi:type IV pilus assembly protein PilB